MTYSEFWLYYLCAHDRAGTRVMHYLGSTGALVLLIIAAITQYSWLILLALVVATPLPGQVIF